METILNHSSVSTTLKFIDHRGTTRILRFTLLFYQQNKEKLDDKGKRVSKSYTLRSILKLIILP